MTGRTCLRAFTLLGLLAGPDARAEAPWLTARGEVPRAARLEVFAGGQTVGGGLVVPDPDPRAALAVELLWSFVDRFTELRVSRQWRLTRAGLATASVQLAVAGLVVPGERLDLGLGPHAGLALSLGGDVVTLQLALQTGVEVFLGQDVPRLPQRALVGLQGCLGPVSVAALARAGADVLPTRGVTFRADFILALGLTAIQEPGR